MRREVIEQITWRLLFSMGLTETVPVPVDDIAEKLSLPVMETNLGQNLGEDVSGVLVTDGGRSYIGVQKTDAPQRRRFTIGHEIGHYFLKHQRNGVHVDRESSITFRAVSHRTTRSAPGSDPREVEANQFAACLLMPSRLVRREARTLTEGTLADRHIQTLAKRFLVSEAAMTIRLQALGLLPLA
jgi:Zn-dependent peptidase ImmA (M78 family)